QYARAYNNRGLAYLAKGNYDRAVADFSESIRLNPDDATYYNNRGIAYEGKQDYDRAIAAFTEAIKLRPNDTIVSHLARARACHKKGLRACLTSDLKAVTDETEQQTASAAEYYAASGIAQYLGHYVLAMKLIDKARSKLDDKTLALTQNALNER